MQDATIIFERVKSYRDIVRSYRIEVDGQRVGKVRSGRELAVRVGAGEHTIKAVIDWASSPASKISVRKGETLRIKVAPAGGPWGTTFRRKSAISLTAEQS